MNEEWKSRCVYLELPGDIWSQSRLLGCAVSRGRTLSGSQNQFMSMAEPISVTPNETHTHSSNDVAHAKSRRDTRTYTRTHWRHSLAPTPNKCPWPNPHTNKIVSQKTTPTGNNHTFAMELDVTNGHIPPRYQFDDDVACWVS